MLWIVGSRRGPWRSALKPGYCWVHFFRCWLDVSRKLLNREVNQLGLHSGHRPGNDPRQPAREIPTAGLEDGRERWPQAFLHERSDYTDYTLFFSHHRTPTWKPHMRMASKDYQKMVSWKKTRYEHVKTTIFLRSGFGGLSKHAKFPSHGPS